MCGKHPYTGTFSVCGKSAVGAGSALGTAAAFLDGDVHGRTTAVIVVAAARIITADGGFGTGWDIVGTYVAVSFIVAIAAANRVGRAGMVNTHAVKATSAALVMAAVGLGTIEITHSKITSGYSIPFLWPSIRTKGGNPATKSSHVQQRIVTFQTYAF